MSSRSGPISRYLAFQGEYYYPAGGWLDFVGSYDSLEDAELIARSPQTQRARLGLDWWHVVDMEIGVIVVSSNDSQLGINGAVDYEGKGYS